VRVPADARSLMAWLTDADRRAADWLGRVEHARHEHVGEPRVTTLPNGGLRFDHAHQQGNRVTRYRVDDVAVGHGKIDRVHRMLQRGPRTMSVRWVMRERITVESEPDGSSVTVRLRGRLTGVRLVAHLFGAQDTATARALAKDAAYRADFRVREIQSRFGAPGPG
jgi:hypothetical protein